MKVGEEGGGGKEERGERGKKRERGKEEKERRRVTAAGGGAACYVPKSEQFSLFFTVLLQSFHSRVPLACVCSSSYSGFFVSFPTSPSAAQTYKSLTSKSLAPSMRKPSQFGTPVRGRSARNIDRAAALFASTGASVLDQGRERVFYTKNNL